MVHRGLPARRRCSFASSCSTARSRAIARPASSMTDVLASLNMRLQPLRRIPTRGRRTLETGFKLDRALFVATMLDETTGEPLERYGALGGPQGWSFHVEWPLPGMADWTGVPVEGHRWQVSAGQLFDTESERGMQCEDWLSQQLVVFNGKPFALHEVIRHGRELRRCPRGRCRPLGRR